MTANTLKNGLPPRSIPSDEACWFLLSCFIIMVFYITLVKSFDHDEFEHIHSAWYLLQGDIPYRDFYQNHHPLLWVLLTPVLWMFGDSSATIFACRILMFTLALGTAWQTCRLTERLTGSCATGLLSMCLSMSMMIFSCKITEIRPDCPQTFFSLLSANAFLHCLETRKMRYAVYSGIASGVAFLFLQKAVYLIAAMTGVWTMEAWNRRASWKHAVLFLAGFIPPIMVLFLWISRHDAQNDYLWCAWLCHLVHLDKQTVWQTLGVNSTQNVAFLAVSTACVIYCLRQKSLMMRLTAWLTLFSFAVIFTSRHPFPQYFLTAISLFSACIAATLHNVLPQCAAHVPLRAAVVAMFTIPFCVDYLPVIHQTRSQQKQQRANIEYVFKNTGKTDLVYDGDIQFNLFRRDLHYFWYSLRPSGGYDTYSLKIVSHPVFGKWIDGKHTSYRIEDLIQNHKPRIISDYRVDKTHPLFHHYAQITPPGENVTHLFVLKKQGDS